jgi:peptidyl-prolyl cis-trans isomerase C
MEVSMTRKLLTVAIAATFVFSIGCKKRAKEEAVAAEAPVEAAVEQEAEGYKPPTGPIATVNGIPIDAEAFNKEIARITQDGAREIPEERFAKIRDNIANRMIEEELIAQEVKKLEIQITAEEIEAEFEKYKGRFKTEEQFENYMTHQKTTAEDVKQDLKRKLALTKLLERLGAVSVTDEEVQKTYEVGIKSYTDPAQAHVQHILVKVGADAVPAQVEAAQAKALEALKKLKAGEDFAKVVAEYSEDIMSKDKGGDLGFFRKGVMVKEFEDAAFALKPGTYTQELVRSTFGFHIIKLIEIKDERVRPLEEVSDQIRESLLNRATFKARRELVQKLKAAATIEKKL